LVAWDWRLIIAETKLKSYSWLPKLGPNFLVCMSDRTTVSYWFWLCTSDGLGRGAIGICDCSYRACSCGASRSSAGPWRVPATNVVTVVQGDVRRGPYLCPTTLLAPSEAFGGGGRPPYSLATCGKSLHVKQQGPNWPLALANPCQRSIASASTLKLPRAAPIPPSKNGNIPPVAAEAKMAA
jgi:hypothetical protein